MWRRVAVSLIALAGCAACASLPVIVPDLDWRSFLHNHELNAVVLGAEFGAQVQAMFDADLAGSDEITLAQWQQRPLSWRAKELFGRLWAYWL